jgi:hypothetical protein
MSSKVDVVSSANILLLTHAENLARLSFRKIRYRIRDLRCISRSSLAASCVHPPLHLTFITRCILRSSLVASHVHHSLHLAFIIHCISRSSPIASRFHHLLHLAFITRCISRSSLAASCVYHSLHLTFITRCILLSWHAASCANHAMCISCPTYGTMILHLTVGKPATKSVMLLGMKEQTIESRMLFLRILLYAKFRIIRCGLSWK